MADPMAMGIAYAGAAMALLGGLVGSSIGIGKAGSAGTAALAEDPKQFRNVFILVSLPMTQTFYGLIVLIQFISYVNGLAEITMAKALAILGLGIAAGAAEWASAWFQGVICASGIAELPRTKGKITFNAMILAVYVELVGILGMVFALMGLSLIS